LNDLLKNKALSIKLLIIVGLLTCLICLYDCGNQKEVKVELKQITFNIDTTELAAQITNKNIEITFNPPRNWQIIDSKLFQKYKTNLQLDTNKNYGVSIIPQNIFTSDSMKCILAISRINFMDKKNVNSLILEKYESVLNNKFANLKIKKAEFMKGNLPIVQYLINEAKYVDFKLLIFNKNKDLIQFDYIASTEIYPKMIQAIESSIGSIQLTK